MSLLLPTDGCPECMTIEKSFPVHPYRVERLADRPGLLAYYRCHGCRYSWFTGWDISALSLPCLGCDACAAEDGAA